MMANKNIIHNSDDYIFYLSQNIKENWSNKVNIDFGPKFLIKYKIFLTNFFLYLEVSFY
jgi:hypothetical protein